jgi:uncharacterized protein DUF3592
MKVLRLVFSIFFAIGLGLLIGSYFTVRHTRHFLQIAISAPGVVVDNIYRESSSSGNQGPSWSYYPHIRFQTTDGQKIDFVSSTGSNPPSYSVNEPVNVLYDPQQPYTASLNSFGSLWGATIVLVILGVAFTAPGIGWFLWKSVSDRKNAWLQQNGRRIQAEITRVELDRSLTVNGANPYRIQCQWLDPERNEMHVFHSSHIWYNPTNYITGKTLEVLVDPNNLHRYAVETSFLPKVS